MMENKPNSLYIHIPFCDHICSYCDFTKLFYYKNYEKPYLLSLFNEIDSYKINKVKTIYIGGGTPTSLSDKGFSDLLSKVSSFKKRNYEFTVEANVENLTINKLKIMQKYGVNRLSIGIQSSSNEILRKIGRFHSFEDAKKIIKKAKEMGFKNINVDFIYGFENQTIEDLKNDLEAFIKLDIDHISIYSLIIEPGSILFNKGKKQQDEEQSKEFYNYILNFLRKNNYKRYEVSNFARNKKYSLHNLNYWKNKEYYGCGLGASGYVNNVRYTNNKNLKTYIDGKYIDSKEEITNESLIEYYLITNLRTENGFSRTNFLKLFKYDFLDMYKDKINQFNLNKYFRVAKNRISLTDEGILLMDFIILKLL